AEYDNAPHKMYSHESRFVVQDVDPIAIIAETAATPKARGARATDPRGWGAVSLSRDYLRRFPPRGRIRLSPSKTIEATTHPEAEYYCLRQRPSRSLLIARSSTIIVVI